MDDYVLEKEFVAFGMGWSGQCAKVVLCAMNWCDWLQILLLTVSLLSTFGGFCLFCEQEAQSILPPLFLLSSMEKDFLRIGWKIMKGGDFERSLQTDVITQI